MIVYVQSVILVISYFEIEGSHPSEGSGWNTHTPCFPQMVVTADGGGGWTLRAGIGITINLPGHSM